MGQVTTFKPRVLEPVEEQEPKQEKKRMLKGQGSVYLRGNIYWIQYRADGKVYSESAKTDKKMEAIDYLKKKTGEFALGHRPSNKLQISYKLRFDGFEMLCKCLKCLVEMKGFEPSAYALRTHRSPI
jgi:hypothetical protein